MQPRTPFLVTGWSLGVERLPRWRSVREDLLSHWPVYALRHNRLNSDFGVPGTLQELAEEAVVDPVETVWVDFQIDHFVPPSAKKLSYALSGRGRAGRMRCIFLRSGCAEGQGTKRRSDWVRLVVCLSIYRVWHRTGQSFSEPSVRVGAISEIPRMSSRFIFLL